MGDVALFTFEELCHETMSAADYLCITKTFTTLIITGVPVLTSSLRDEARRFIILIDILYDKKIRLVMQSEAPPASLFQLSECPSPAADHLRELADELSLPSEVLVFFISDQQLTVSIAQLFPG